MSKKHSNVSAVPLHPAFKKTELRPMIAEYDPKKQGDKTEISDLVMTQYKSTEAVSLSNGSIVPLYRIRDEETGNYNPFANRSVTHPTTDFDTLIHLLKGSLGSGILAMPLAFANAGLWVGLFGTFIIGAICTYCVHILVKCSQVLCRRAQVPSLDFSEVALVAFLGGPGHFPKYSRLARLVVNTFLVIDLFGCCIVYTVFIGKNLKQLGDVYIAEINLRLYMLAVLPFLIAINLIRNLKYLAPFSCVANVLVACSIGITFYYVFQDMPSVSERENPEFTRLPMFFGTVIFALEGIGVVMPLENNMNTPGHFIGCPGVLNIGMFCVIMIYSSVGFFGFLKYGSETRGSITLNLPQDEYLGQLVKLCIAFAMFFTYALQFYVPMDIIWKYLRPKVNPDKQLIVEYALRIAIVIATVMIAIAVPNLGPVISLCGAVCLSVLGLMAPSFIEIATYWERPGMGRFYWRLWKNIALISFGIVGFFTGSYVSIQDIIANKD